MRQRRAGYGGNSNTAGTGWGVYSAGNFAVARIVATSGSSTAVTVTGAANTKQTLSTEIPDLDLNLGRTVQWATGALTTQRAVRISAPIYSFVGASTMTDAATLGITGAPMAGTNATLTNTHGLLISIGYVGFLQALNSYGLTVNAPFGAWNNYAAAFMGGNVGIGTANPGSKLEVNGGGANVVSALLSGMPQALRTSVLVAQSLNLALQARRAIFSRIPVKDQPSSETLAAKPCLSVMASAIPLLQSIRQTRSASARRRPRIHWTSPGP